MVKKVMVFVVWLAVWLLAELLVIGGAAGILLALVLWGVPLAVWWAVLLLVVGTGLLVYWMVEWLCVLTKDWKL